MSGIFSGTHSTKIRLFCNLDIKFSFPFRHTTIDSNISWIFESSKEYPMKNIGNSSLKIRQA